MFRLVALVLIALPACAVSGTSDNSSTLPPAPPAAAAVQTGSRSCVTDTSPGDHTFTCGGLRVDMRAPRQCPPGGCGLILLVHGDTGTGLLEDAHVKLRDLGETRGYLVVAPTGPPIAPGDFGSTWRRENDGMLIDIVRAAAEAFHADPKRIHITGFSRGGFVTWRLLCDHADLFASAAPAAAGISRSEVTCFTGGRAPSRRMPILFLMGRADLAVRYPSMEEIRTLALAHYEAKGPEVVSTDAKYTHHRWTGAGGVVFETFEHSYETLRGGPWGDQRGHCIPGSTTDPRAPQYALPCVGQTAFSWGEEVVNFFDKHPQ